MKIPGAPAFFSDMDPGYGLAMEKYDDTFNFIGHSGRTQAYNAQMYYIPSQKAVLITLVNTESTIGDGPLFFETVSKIIFPDSFPRIIGK